MKHNPVKYSNLITPISLLTDAILKQPQMTYTETSAYKLQLCVT